MVRDCFPEHDWTVPPSVEAVPHQDWVIHVQSTWKPILVANRFVLTFPWHKETDIEQVLLQAATTSENDKEPTKAQRSDYLELQLQGGIAFGTGEHPTTQLCLEWLSDILPTLVTKEESSANDDNDDNGKDIEQVLQASTASENDNEPTKAQRSDYLELQLQGGIAFGTGEHPTTQLCLEWLSEILPTLVTKEESSANDDDDDDNHVWLMDYGAGSGILGMAACRLSQEIAAQSSAPVQHVRAIGVDIDVDACRIANENAQQNQVNMKNYLPPLSSAADDVSKALLLKAQQYAQAQLDQESTSQSSESPHDNALFMPESLQTQQYQVCVANILAGPLMALAPTLAALLQPGGYLGLSGILQHLGDDVAEAYRQAGLVDVQVERTQGGWALVTGRKKLAE
eukprot:CAMPEP_0172473504 /NCGR_PEP_ID=MMETSP1065-20121228/68889_1 /TAXON_ID=265537 /ORGANISM="Amphiprora paludosa, Strain CCMP125" /LENGTH=398 /DNA_ID=CAMNT_0013231679 /DNA_START=99 /DNA_END=1296 /DNA_ORIENTATION=-